MVGATAQLPIAADEPDGDAAALHRWVFLATLLTSVDRQHAISASGASILTMTSQDRKEHERAQRRQIIIDAARELAEAEGWESVTTRRLADRIEYSQPVLYSHFDGKDAIVRAVALDGFGELGGLLAKARKSADPTVAEARAVAYAYVEFPRANPAVYEAMFTLTVDLTFGQSDTPAPLHQAFVRAP